MSSRPWDVRLRRVTWQPVPTSISVKTRVRLLALLGLPFAVWYFGWLLNPDRIGTPYLYGLLIAAEIFNMIQALGFWWTCGSERVRKPKAPSQRVAVDVYVPVYKEPVDIVDLTVAAAASWSQQALFFGAIARGKEGLGAVFCCGTNVLFRREAFESVGGFPTNSLTEDYELSIWLHEAGWKSVYVPDVLSRGLGPEDMAAYVSQQQRWARGCLSGLPRALRARLPLKLKVQYVLSASYFLSGWTVLIYMSFPVIRLLTGGQPIAGITAPEFLLHFAPYFAVALTTAALAGAGSYTFAAFALAAANFWIHCLATVYTVLRKEGSFVVTPKKGAAARQPSAVMPALVVVGILVGVSIYGLIKAQDAATLNNVCFAAVHVSILMTGCWPALAKPRVPDSGAPELAEVAA